MTSTKDDLLSRIDAYAHESARNAMHVFTDDIDSAIRRLNRTLTDADSRWEGLSRLAHFSVEYAAMLDRIEPEAQRLRKNVLRTRFSEMVAAGELRLKRNVLAEWITARVNERPAQVVGLLVLTVVISVLLILGVR